jgi:hypothetical protein
MRTALVSQPEGGAYLVATGALTNVALLMTTYPELISHIKGLSIMGGAIGTGFSEAPMGHAKGERFGNITKYSEFNIYVRTLSCNQSFGFQSADFISAILKQLSPSSRTLNLPLRRLLYRFSLHTKCLQHRKSKNNCYMDMDPL